MLDVSNELFQTYAFYAGLLVVKISIMTVLTIRHRLRKAVFANIEDAQYNKTDKVNLADPDVERVRRAHLNDLENIVPFLIISLLYIFTNPDLGTTALLFKIFTGARYIHTFVYAIYPVPQPARALAWLVGYVITFYMSFRVISYMY